MKALSIKQPWASLIAHGIKDIENRTWKTNFRGRIYIHASAKFAFRHFDEMLDDNQLELAKELNCVLHTSAIIGEVDIVDCVINHPSIWAEKTHYFAHTKVPIDKIIYNWVLSNPMLYDKPILNVKGKLSFWDFEKKQSVCNYCLEFVDELIDGVGCENCNKKYK
jgi:hypothetical protein